MLIEHDGRSPQVDPAAWVAPNATLVGDVRIGPDSRVLHGAVLNAGDGSIEIGTCAIVMENALIRGRARAPASIGDHCLVGPHSHVNGAEVGDCCFIATGASLFPGSRLGAGCEVRINAVVHVGSALDPESVVPIGWVAVGDPASILAPGDHDSIWAIQRELGFPERVLGVERGPALEMMPRAMRGYSERFGSHRDDRDVTNE